MDRVRNQEVPIVAFLLTERSSTMKIINLFAGFALAISALTTSVMAQDFVFETQGEGEIDWALDFSESETFTATSGAEYTFNGGAGTDGGATAEGDIAGTYSFSDQFAGGSGVAVDENGNTYAAAQFSSGSYVETGGFAGDLAFDEMSEVSVGGIVTAGGAGSVGTGESTGFEYDYSQEGSGSLNYEFEAEQSVN